MRDQNHHLSDRDLVLAIDGELPARRQAAADAHLIGCAECSARRTRVVRMSALVTDLYEADSLEIEPIEGSRRKLRATLTEFAQTNQGARGSRLSPSSIRIP